MASEIINQKDIDEMLRAFADDSSVKEKEENNLSFEILKRNVYRGSKKPLYCNTSQYRSPILKPHQIVFNPPPGSKVDNRKVVVQTVEHYLLSKKVG